MGSQAGELALQGSGSAPTPAAPGAGFHDLSWLSPKPALCQLLLPCGHSQDVPHSPSVWSHGSEGAPRSHYSAGCPLLRPPHLLGGPGHLCLMQLPPGGPTAGRAGQAQLLWSEHPPRTGLPRSTLFTFSLLTNISWVFVFLIETLSGQ